MDWRSALFEKWPYKLTALLLALLLWVVVSAEERQEEGVTTAVEWVVEDTAWVLVDAPEEVTTVFQGRITDFMSFVGNRPVLRYAVDTVTDSRMTVNFSTAMVRFGGERSVRPVTVRPSAAVLRFEPRVAKTVPVELALELSPAEGFEVVGEPVVEPDSVRISGAESQVAAITAVTTERVEIADFSSSVRRDVRVRLPGDADHVTAEPPIVLATVRVDSVVERTFHLPVQVRGEGDGYVLDPDSVRVRVRGPGRHVGELSAGDVEAYVNPFGSLEPGARRAVEVSLSDGEGLSVEVEPSEVGIRRREAGG